MKRSQQRPFDLNFDFGVQKYPPLPRLNGLMVTGTDTGVGKTIVAGAIAQYFRHAGKNVSVFKPIATGCHRRREGLFSEDGEFLAACADSRQSLSQIVPICLGPAMSPNIAARRAGQTIDLQTIFDAYAAMLGQSDITIVEGVGGLLCPITDDFWVIHFARLIQLPIVIVARAGLGTINHTLLTIHAARSAGLTVAGVVINGYQIEPQRRQHLKATSLAQASPAATDGELSELNNPDQIAKLGNVDILAIVPQESGNSVSAATIGKDTQFAIKQVSWESLLENTVTN